MKKPTYSFGIMTGHKRLPCKVRASKRVKALKAVLGFRDKKDRKANCKCCVKVCKA